MPLRVVNECLQAHRSQDWKRLRELLHPDARIGVFAAGGKPVDPEVAIAAMQTAHQELTYFANVESARVLDNHAVLLSGHVQYTSEAGSVVRDRRVWLYVLLDNFLYRSQVFETEDDAFDTYERLGLTLGVPEAAPMSADAF